MSEWGDITQRPRASIDIPENDLDTGVYVLRKLVVGKGGNWQVVAPIIRMKGDELEIFYLTEPGAGTSWVRLTGSVSYFNSKEEAEIYKEQCLEQNKVIGTIIYEPKLKL